MKKSLGLLLLPLLFLNFCAIAQTPDGNGIVYVKPTATGSGNGSSWSDATADLQGAINAAGTQKVFVAVGNYDVPSPHSFVLKDNVQVYGGFDPASGISDLAQPRVMPDMRHAKGSILNGRNERPVIWNVNNGVTATAILDGFALTNAAGTNQASIYNTGTSPTLRNLLVIGNNTSGIYNSNASPRLSNVAVVNNVGAVGLVQAGGTSVLTNVTLAGNTVELLVTAGGVTVNNSIICGTIDGNLSAFLNNSSLVTAGPMALSSLFSDASNGDYTLKHSAAVVNAGNNALSAGMDATSRDLGGRKRIYGSAIDMGAYEFNVFPDADGIIYVREAAVGNATGDSWTNATSDLQGAIDAMDVDKVFVALGTYTSKNNTGFVMKNGVGIYGGFDPDNGISSMAHQRILPNESILGSVLDGQQAGRVVYNDFDSGNALDNSAVLDGFTLKNGYLNDFQGAGMLNYSASPTLNNLVFRDNHAAGGTGSGAAMCNDGGSSPLISHTLFINNTAEGTGIIYSSGNSNPVIQHTVIKKNVKEAGVLLYFYNSSATVKNTLIVDNQIAYVSLLSGGSLSLQNVTVANNRLSDDSPAFNVNLSNGATASVSNSILFGRTVGNNFHYTHSLVSGNTNTADGNINTWGIAMDHIFNNPSGGDYTLKKLSLAINAGSNSRFIGLDGNTRDLLGNPRVYRYANNGVIDLGAYESAYTPIVASGGVVYVRAGALGTEDGSSWDNATSDLHQAIHSIGVQKVFVAVGEYKVGDQSFVMKNGVEIYGGFDPQNGITDLIHNRVLPNTRTFEGTVLDGEQVRPVVWNDFTSATALDNTAVLDGFTIKGGKAASGGGIYNHYASPILNNLVIRENTVTANGGGIRNGNSSPVISNSIIRDNTANRGGGIYNNASSPMLKNLEVMGNTAFQGGGMLNEYANGVSLVNVKLNNNHATGSGSMVYNFNSTASMANVQATGNTGNFAVQANGSGLRLVNVTLHGNGSNAINTLNSGTVDIHNSLVFGALNGTGYGIKHSLVEGRSSRADGNIDATGITAGTVFADAPAGDYTLKNLSPAINAGDNGLFSGLALDTKDLAANDRVFNYANGGIIDLGAYESAFNSPLAPDADKIIYVRENTMGTGSGNSWANATGDLHNAIHASGVQKVFVAIGDYKVGEHSFVMKSNVGIYGGFDPVNNIIKLSDARVLPNWTSSDGSVLNGENVRPVVWNIFTAETAIDNTAILDGFTVANGGGGGIRNTYASPILRNLVVRNNAASRVGGGIANFLSSPVITDVVIRDNLAKDGGGGIFNSQANVIVTNTVIKDNRTAGFTYFGGGGICNEDGSQLLMDGVTISNNVAGLSGGGIANRTSSSMTLINSWLTDNTARYGGGLYNRDAAAELTNVTITGNKATLNALAALGGGGVLTDGSSPRFTNVLIADNISDFRGGGLRSLSGNPIFTNVTIAKNTATNAGGTAAIEIVAGTPGLNNSIVYGTVTGTYAAQNSLIEGSDATANGNLDATGITMDSIFTDHTVGDYSLRSTSPVINKGNAALYLGLAADTKDLGGEARVYGSSGLIDLGVYEYQGDPAVLPVDLIAYVAKVDGNRAQLKWQTASERDNAKFVVYRSGDGQTFREIGERLGVGSSTTTNSYTFYDHSPLAGDNYYRLLQVDHNGKTNDLGVRVLKFSLQSLDIRLYPNPTDKEVEVLFGKGNFKLIKLMDVNGKVLQQFPLNGSEANRKLSLSDYPAGVYFVQLVGRGNTERRKVVKR